MLSRHAKPSDEGFAPEPPCNDRVKSIGCRGGCSPAPSSWRSTGAVLLASSESCPESGDQARIFAGLTGHRARTGPTMGSPVIPGSRAPPTLAPDPGREPTRTVELAQVQTREV